MLPFWNLESMSEEDSICPWQEMVRRATSAACKGAEPADCQESGWCRGPHWYLQGTVWHRQHGGHVGLHQQMPREEEHRYSWKEQAQVRNFEIHSIILIFQVPTQNCYLRIYLRLIDWLIGATYVFTVTRVYFKFSTSYLSQVIFSNDFNDVNVLVIWLYLLPT